MRTTPMSRSQKNTQHPTDGSEVRLASLPVRMAYVAAGIFGWGPGRLPGLTSADIRSLARKVDKDMDDARKAMEAADRLTRLSAKTLARSP